MGDAKQRANPGARAATRRVIVAGDVTLDWNLARTRKLVDSGIAWNATDRTEMYSQPGGAALMAGLIGEVASSLRPIASRTQAAFGREGVPARQTSRRRWAARPRSRRLLR
jgi:hypothetical protein